jgi:hypothetical protein
MKWSRRFFAFFVSSSLALASVAGGCATAASEPDMQSQDQPEPPPSADTGSVAEPSAEDLDQLVAPIALYPDALVAQILAAATYPSQISEADRWIQQNPDLKADALAKAVDPQPWDPSVKALAQFPSVLAMMDKNLSWTSSLGDAYVNDQQNVLDAVQVMRQRAEQAGNLKSTQQENVTNDGQAIDIEPTDPEVVYVPEYDPWAVYGAPVPFYPDWYGMPGLYIDGPGIAWGAGIGIGVFGGFGWGWHHWGADWHRHDLMFDHNRYVSHSSTFVNRHDFGRGGFNRGGGFAHGGPAPGGGFPHAGPAPGGGFAHGGPAPGGGFAHGGPAPGGGFPHATPIGGGGIPGGAMSGNHSSAFSGFNHGGVASSFSSRGRASFGGGSHGGGGFHGGGGGGHGGGGGGHR